MPRTPFATPWLKTGDWTISIDLKVYLSIGTVAATHGLWFFDIWGRLVSTGQVLVVAPSWSIATRKTDAHFIHANTQYALAA